IVVRGNDERSRNIFLSFGVEVLLGREHFHVLQLKSERGERRFGAGIHQVEFRRAASRCEFARIGPLRHNKPLLLILILLGGKAIMLHTRGNKLTWLGHATFRITTPSGKAIIVDPWVKSNPACPESLKTVEKLDTLLITHGHFDHIADAVELGKKFKPQIVAIPETCAWLESKGVENTSSMNKGGTQKVGEIEVTMVNAVHSCGITDGDKIVYGGEACGYVIRLPGGLTLYHAGDTAVFGDMKLIGELYSPDLAMLPIGDHY